MFISNDWFHAMPSLRVDAEYWIVRFALQCSTRYTLFYSRVANKNFVSIFTLHVRKIELSYSQCFRDI